MEKREQQLSARETRFSVNIAKFLRKVFLQNIFGGCFWKKIWENTNSFGGRWERQAKWNMQRPLELTVKFRDRHLPLHKKWSFPLRISFVNVTKFAWNCGFGHIYWTNPLWKTSFFVQCTTLWWQEKSLVFVWQLYLEKTRYLQSDFVVQQIIMRTSTDLFRVYF